MGAAAGRTGAETGTRVAGGSSGNTTSHATSNAGTGAQFAGNTSRGGAGGATNTTNTGTTSAGAGAVTFARIYAEIIQPNCAVCHTSGSGASSGQLHMGDRLGAFTDLVGNDMLGVNAAGSACASSGLKRVTPGNAQTSLLWQKVNAKAHGETPVCGNGMPATAGATLTQAQVDLIAKWINEGAKAI
jgi:mono/diheme cytochrome c family protein